MRELTLGARKSTAFPRIHLRACLVMLCLVLDVRVCNAAQDLVVQGFGGLPSGPGKIRVVAGRDPVLEISSNDASTAFVRSLSLPAQRLAGYLVTMSCEVSADNVSAKPESWNGIKVAAHIAYPGGETWPQANVPVGTFATRRVFVRFQVPENATEVSVRFGLEKVTGTVRFSGLSIVRGERFARAAAAPSDQPIFTGHDDVPRLRGAMVDPKITESDIDTFAGQWHGNLIRWQLLCEVPGANGPAADFAAYDAWLDGALAKTDLVLGWAARHHVKVVLDLHTPPGGKGWSTGSLFVERAAQKHFVEVWRKMTQRYKGNTTIWGFDLVNEPDDDDTAPDCQDWQGLSLIGARAVREIDPSRTLIVEPPKSGSAVGWTYFNPLPLEHVVYSFHMYDPLRFTHQGVIFKDGAALPYPGTIEGKTWNREALREAMQPAIEFARRYRVQMYVGEFSAVRWAPGADRYLADVTGIFEEQGWDWSYHAFREWQGWNLELGPKRDDLNVSATPTARFEVIERLWKMNQPAAP